MSQVVLPTFTVEQYQALVSAIAQGATTVKYGDKEVTYRSLNEMLRLMGVMETQLGSQVRPERRVADYHSGF